jgi:hypothetical protein
MGIYQPNQLYDAGYLKIGIETFEFFQECRVLCFVHMIDLYLKDGSYEIARFCRYQI